MSSLSEFTQNDYQVIARSYADLKESARKRCTNARELEVVQKAFEFASEAHKNVRRRSGEPYILHPIAVAKIVVDEIGLGYKSITAALLHDVVEDTDYTVADIRRLFGDKIASLVDGLTKIKGVLDNQDRQTKGEEYSESLQAMNFKRILLTMNDDIRVILIKLADRLHNCRTIEYMPEYKRDKILSETMYIFIPLAHRLGLYEIKSEMENIWLRYKEPDAYNDITAKVNRDMAGKGIEIDKFIEPISKALTASGFDFTIKKRIKSAYSIWHKMKTKKVTFEQIYDLFAVRIVFNPDPRSKESERDQCYHIFSIITGLYTYKADRVRDWVKHPKSNGYEALHVTLTSNQGKWIEVQIRTKRMDDIAERGIAAHWMYKKDGKADNDSAMDQWLQKVKDILVSPNVNDLELLDIIHNDLVTSDMTVFTPKGEQKVIQHGATALDFAYQIHTEIGNRAIAAKVNMKLVPLSTVLHQGDTVEIITAETGKPSKDWFRFLQTRHAKNKLMDYFRADSPEITEYGHQALEATLKAAGASLDQRTVMRLVNNLEVKSKDELFFRYALGLITTDQILQNLSMDAIRADKPGKIDHENFVIGSPSDPHKYVIADCCHPISGDPVIGILTPDGTVTVHKKACPVAQSFLTKHGEWAVIPHWTAADDQSFLVRIALRGIDRVGILNEITGKISREMGVNMRKLQIGADQGIFDGSIDMMVKDKDTLEKIISIIQGIDGIQTVQRVDI